MASLNTLISVAHAGGHGKTTVAQLLYIAAQRVGANYKIAAADNMDESGKSKIGKLYGEKVEEYGTGALLTAARTENNRTPRCATGTSSATCCCPAATSSTSAPT